MARTNVTPQAGFVPLNATEKDFIILPVASAYGTALYPGDPVLGLTDGSVALTPAGSAAGAATDGITGTIVEIVQFKDSNGIVRRNGCHYLPASTSWTAHADRSLVKVCLANSSLRYQVRASAAAASLTAWRAQTFANADHSFSGADSDLGISGARINLSTLNTTNTLQWRVLEGLDKPGNDPLQTDYTLVVIPNLIYALPIVGHSATGI